MKAGIPEQLELPGVALHRWDRVNHDPAPLDDAGCFQHRPLTLPSETFHGYVGAEQREDERQLHQRESDEE